MTDPAGLPDVPPLPPFADPARMVAGMADRLRSPRRMTVSDAAAKYRYLRNPGGGYTGPWKNEQVPYLVEPADQMTSRKLEGVVFVGPAQSGKTDGLILNPIAHSVMCDPADMMVVQTAENMARDFSKRRIARMNRDSREIGARLDIGKSADNVFDKAYHGMMLTIGFPSIAQLSGRPIPRMLLTDVDRMSDDVDGEGLPFDLARKRTQTFGSRGITLAESSPGRNVLDPKWKPTTPHEAPPTTGILALYNRGDRRRWQWPCPSCGEFFEGSFARLQWDDTKEVPAETVVMVCPANGCVIEPRHKAAMNAAGRWVAEGQEVLADGTVVGEPIASRIASYWLKGPAAAFQTWVQLVQKYLDAQADYERTGAEEALKTTVNTDQAEPYLPKVAEVEGTVEAEELVERAEHYPFRKVPLAARFLTASVDVQSNRFEVLVRAWGKDLESWPVDWFQVFKTTDGDGSDRPVDPATQAEDWDLLVAKVIDKAYPLADRSGRSMKIAAVAIDSGGAAGVTDKAYDFWRRCERRNRVMLVKGASYANAPRVAKSYPDSKRKDRKAGARGEIPVWFFNTNLLKDELQAQLRKAEPGPRFVHLPQALVGEKPPHPFFEQVTAEDRKPDGKWVKAKKRNEALDLMVMSHVAALALKADRMNWSSPPAWAAELDRNPLVVRADGGSPPAVSGTARPQPAAGRRVRNRGIG